MVLCTSRLDSGQHTQIRWRACGNDCRCERSSLTSPNGYGAGVVTRGDRWKSMRGERWGTATRVDRLSPASHIRAPHVLLRGQPQGHRQSPSRGDSSVCEALDDQRRGALCLIKHGGIDEWGPVFAIKCGRFIRCIAWPGGQHLQPIRERADCLLLDKREGRTSSPEFRPWTIWIASRSA